MDDLRKGHCRRGGGAPSGGSTSPSSPESSPRGQSLHGDTNESKPNQVLETGRGNALSNSGSDTVPEQPGDDAPEFTSTVQETVNEDALQMAVDASRIETEGPGAEKSENAADSGGVQACSVHQKGSEEDPNSHGRETSSSEVEEFDDASDSLHQGIPEHRPSKGTGLKGSKSEHGYLEALSADSPRDAAARASSTDAEGQSPGKSSAESSSVENEGESLSPGHDTSERQKPNACDVDSQQQNAVNPQEAASDMTGAPTAVELKPGNAAAASEGGSSNPQTSPEEPDPADQPGIGEKSAKAKKPESKKDEGVRGEGQIKGDQGIPGEKEEEGGDERKKEDQKGKEGKGKKDREGKEDKGGNDGKGENGGKKDKGGNKEKAEKEGKGGNEDKGENDGERGNEEKVGNEGKGGNEDKGGNEGTGEKEGKGEKRGKQQEKQEKVKKRASAGASLGGSSSPPEAGSPGGEAERPESCTIS